MMRKPAGITLLILVVGICRLQAQAISPFADRLAEFESVLEVLQLELKIPGMSAALVKDQELIWSRGYGYADLENGIESTEDTAYYLASLTKTFASTILIQLVEQGRLDLNDPVSRYGVRIKSDGTILVRHLFSHTSEGVTGSYYKYDGGRFAHLDRVIKKAAGRSFDELLMDNIVRPLSLVHTVPGTRRQSEEFSHISATLAKPYALDDNGEIVETAYPTYFGVSAGLISTVGDMAKYITAIERNALIGKEAQQVAFKPQMLNSGAKAPYGLGWFVQEFDGTSLIWHYGFNHRIVSTLILYTPNEGLAFIIFANSDNLSRPFWLGLGDVLRSPAAAAFVKYFITAERTGTAVPKIPWHASRDDITAELKLAREAGYGAVVRQELISRFMMLRQFGEWERAEVLLDIYADLYTDPSPSIDLPRIAGIELVENDQYRILEFELRQDATIRVHAVGESSYHRLFDFGGIEDKTAERLIWKMRLEGSQDAGGALKNREVDEILELPAGSYRLHYKSDGAHSFGRWNDIPPDELFWGVSLYLVDPTARLEDVLGSVRPVQATTELRLLDEVTFPREKPPISPWGYFALIVFLLLLSSSVVWPPVRRLYKIAARRKRSLVAAGPSGSRWMKALAWIAGINGAVCSIHIVPALLAGRLEGLVANGIPMLSEAWWKVMISLPLASACLVVSLTAATAFGWWKRMGRRSLRIYYSLTAIAAAGYLILLNHWRLIVIPA
jgi:CubicO group peptidase (beta-lactamase class C family)